MPCLVDVQRGFRNAVLAGDGAPPPPEIMGGKVSAAARLGVYRNNVIGNLVRTLRLSYPAVERLVGEDFFAAAARCFIMARPPNVADLNKYGEGFADFLASFEPAASLPYLADVARLEWAVDRALQAPASLPLAPDALRKVPAERQADLRFEAHPTLSLLPLVYPARTIWQAVLTADADARARSLGRIHLGSGGETLAVRRGECGLDIAILSDQAFDLARALANGCALGEALERIAPEDAASMLADFLTRGFFADVFLPEQRPPTTEGKAR